LTNHHPQEQSGTRGKGVYGAKDYTILFLSIQFLGLYLFGGIRTIYPLFLELHLNYSEIQVLESWGIILSLGMFVGTITRLPMGIFADRYTRKQVLMVSLVLITVSIAGMIFFTNIIILALLFGLLRSGAHLFPLLSRGYVQEKDARHHGRLNALIMFSASAGTIIAPIIFIFLLEVSPQIMIITTSIFTVISISFLIITIPNREEIKPLPLKSQLSNSAKDIVNMKLIAIIFIISGVFNGIYDARLVPHMQFNLDLDPAIIGLLVSFIRFATMFLILIMGEMVDRFGTNNLIITGIGIEFVGGILVFLLINNPITFILGQILLAIGITTIITGSTTYLSLSASQVSFATTFGAMTSFFFLGSSIGPSIANYLYIIEPSFPYIFISILIIMSLPLIIKFYKSEPKFKLMDRYKTSKL
jgi:MFS family permease